MADLISLSRALVNVPSATSSDYSTISTLITAVSKVIQRICDREFSILAYDEFYNGDGQRRLMLRRYPILSVQSVRYRPVTVLKIINHLVNTPQARVEVLNTGLRLTTVTSGVANQLTGGLDWVTNPTLLALQNAVNAAGSGWSAAGQGYDAWPSADLYCPNGISPASGGPIPTGQGALTAAGQYAELKLHTYELAGWQMDQRQGWLLRAIPYTDPELLHPEDMIWPTGINNFRVQYTAGYLTVPEDVQEACAEWVAALFWQTRRDPGLANESVPQAFSRVYLIAQKGLPPYVQALLPLYKQHAISIPGG